MTGVLEDVRVVEVSMWAFVPSTGAILAEWGADVVKIEGPSGDPVRGLVTAGLNTGGPRFTWEMWNRGKRGIAVDLTHPSGQRVVHELVADADVFLTSLLPGSRERMGIDFETIRSHNPQIVYAAGTAQGPQGPEADKGGYDSLTFWNRGGVAASVTPPGADPIGMPAGAFGDSLSGMALAAGVAAALARKFRTGEGCLVEGALLGTALWAMQMSITGADAAGLEEMPRMSRTEVPNPLVNNYRTSDERWIALCMLQPDAYWPGFCQAVGRGDLLMDDRFAGSDARTANAKACIAELDTTFASQPLAYWRERLGQQKGQWDVLNSVSDVLRDRQVRANRYAQKVSYDEGSELALVTTPIHFDRTPPVLRRAPTFGRDTDEVLQELGWSMEAIMEAKIDGGVV